LVYLNLGPINQLLGQLIGKIDGFLFFETCLFFTLNFHSVFRIWFQYEVLKQTMVFIGKLASNLFKIYKMSQIQMSKLMIWPNRPGPITDKSDS
jgi:uncharacterized membrane protein required for colicin V production